MQEKITGFRIWLAQKLLNCNVIRDVEIRGNLEIEDVTILHNVSIKNDLERSPMYNYEVVGFKSGDTPQSIV